MNFFKNDIINEMSILNGSNNNKYDIKKIQHFRI